MATVREARIKTAAEAIGKSVDLVNLTLRNRARVEVVAEDVVDALFTDHTFDNVQVSDE